MSSFDVCIIVYRYSILTCPTLVDYLCSVDLQSIDQLLCYCTVHCWFVKVFMS